MYRCCGKIACSGGRTFVPNELVQMLEKENPNGNKGIYKCVRTGDLEHSSKIPIEALYPGLTPLVNPGNQPFVISGQELTVAKNVGEVEKETKRKLGRAKCLKEVASEHNVGAYSDPSNKKLNDKQYTLAEEQKMDNIRETNGDEFETKSRDLNTPSTTGRKMSSDSNDLIDFSDPRTKKGKAGQVNKETPIQDADVVKTNLQKVESLQSVYLSNRFYTKNIDSGQDVNQFYPRV